MIESNFFDPCDRIEKKSSMFEYNCHRWITIVQGISENGNLMISYLQSEDRLPKSTRQAHRPHQLRKSLGRLYRKQRPKMTSSHRRFMASSTLPQPSATPWWFLVLKVHRQVRINILQILEKKNEAFFKSKSRIFSNSLALLRFFSSTNSKSFGISYFVDFLVRYE